MIKKILIFVLTLFVFDCIKGQELSDGMMEIVPPSPTPFQLTKYGSIPVNECSGMISPNINIYEYIAGRINVPIYFNYHGNGVKVDQLSTWTGINWNLNAGGVITRTVKDIPDEVAYKSYRINKSREELNSMVICDYSDDILLLNTLESSKAYDTQVDIFNFSFLGFSGSFFLDEDLKPVLANYDKELEIKLGEIDINKGIADISIKAPNGIEYFFGGDNATERTVSNPNIPESLISANTSFYLTKIKHPNGDEVYFEYCTENNSYFIRLSQSQHIYIVGPGVGYSCPPSNNTNIQNTFIQLQKVINGKYLRKISSNRDNIVVLFNSTETETGYEYKRVLNDISVQDGLTNNEYKKFSLYYISNSQRFFLERVKVEGSMNNNKKLYPHEYRMEYNDPEGLPNRLSYKQDHLGYYNNKNNITLLPKDIEGGVFEFLNASLADREPDFYFAQKGSLKKLCYPTGGYSQFEYEAPPVKKENKKRVFLNTYCSSSNLTPDSKLTDNYNLGSAIDEDGNIIFPTIAQTVVLKTNVLAHENVNHHYKICIKVTDLYENTVQTNFFALSPNITDYYYEYSIDVKTNHNYRFSIELIPNPESNNSPFPVNVNTYFDYTQGYVNGEGLGIRVKRVLDYPSLNSSPVIKRYYYKEANSSCEFENNISSINTASYVYITDNLFCCQGGNGRYLLAHLQSSTVNQIFPASDSQWLYKNVTISFGGDNFENGGVQKVFFTRHASYPETFFSLAQPCFLDVYHNQRDNTDIFNGTLEKEIYFEKFSDNQLRKIKEIKYVYYESFLKFITNLIVKRPYSYCMGAPNYSNADGLYVGFYNTYSYKRYLHSLTTKEFIEPVPININDDTSYKKIISEKEFSYLDYIGLPYETIFSTSNSNVKFITRNYYPIKDFHLENIDASEELNIRSMYDQHMIESPIQIENYVEKNGSRHLLSIQRTLYNSSHLPKIVKFSYENNPFETEIIYQKYDNFGNPTQILKKNGITTSYYWGYRKNFPVISGENIDYETISALAVNSLPSGFISLDELLLSLNTPFDNNWKTFNKNLRLNNNLSDFKINTYTYDPTNGITSITDPNNISVNYDYDGLGRLNVVKDYEGNLLKRYYYHYSGKPILDNFFNVNVAFDSQGGSSVESITANYNTCITAPEIPMKMGYTFTGWYKESACINEWNFGTDTVMDNITLYAKWTPNTYPITYNLNEGTNSTSNPATYIYGVGVTLSNPSRTGYTFEGWYKEEAYATMVTAISPTSIDSISLYAKWTINTYTVTFDSQDGSTASPITVNFNTKISAPPSLTRTGYTFGGWYKESSCTNAWNFISDRVTSNTILYAKWTLNSYTISLTVIGGTGGTVTPSGNSTIFFGDDLTYNITPYPGYMVKDINIDGVSVDSITSYTFQNVSSNKTLSVEFESIYINADNNSPAIGLSGGSLNLVVSANTPWTISSNVSWCTVTPSSANGNTTVIINCTSARRDRSGVLTLIGGGITLNIPITQSNIIL